MLNIWSMRGDKGDRGGRKALKLTAAQLRVQKDVSELEEYATMKPIWENKENMLEFKLQITPDEGMYKGGVYNFVFNITDAYPHEAPKVKCTQKIYHPNIDLEGNVCLNILREDWKPVLNLNSVFVGLQYLFLEPNAADPLNKDAAQVLRQDRDQFIRNVKTSISGRYIDGVQYDNVQDSSTHV
ncbi:hypothetical protein EW145_g3886 [Phellinidium pouzarii]|uniref:NEDD8-conjugating enzyme UBC12 n=1 Tax=Phellinidium pouzarii TaxID=167371 RepID=A0A4S4L7D4_9AGAM|nr:hypothetical protein EW145_g3886 [Phellinidium pouzarii]